MKSTHSTPRSKARDMPLGVSDSTELAEVSGRRLRVDTERRLLARFWNQGLALSKVSIFLVLWILAAWLLPSSLPEGASRRLAPGALAAFAAAKVSSPTLMTTEQEIRGFFDQYVQRYNKMDIEGFLGLFSSKAKQNEQDGIPEIRTLYSDFFRQTMSVRNSIEDMKIEIYQNAAEVKARFTINQVLKKGGEKKVLKGSGRWVLIKEDGMLKILSIGYKLEKTL